MSAQLMISILLILLVAWAMGSLFSRWGFPFVLGQLVAGVILGPPLLGLIQPSPALELLSELGIFFVMFHAGMEMDPKELIEHIWPSLAVAAGGFILPFALGFGITRLFGGTIYQSLFVGLGISITAIAVQSIILYSMRISKTSLGHIIIGAAIADDILALVGLSFLLGIVKSGSVEYQSMLFVFLKVTGFFALIFILGHYAVPPFTRKLHDRQGTAFTFAIAVALLMAFLAELAGLHLVIGAFLAGQFLRKEILNKAIYSVIVDRFYGISYGFLVPIFFASLSFHLHFLWDASFIVFASLLIAAAVVGKVVGCGLGLALFRHNFWESAVVGFGMNGRGAVEVVVASIVLKLSNEFMTSKVISVPLLTQTQFSALILMAFVTTMIAPLTLKWSIMKTCLPHQKADFCQLWDERQLH